MSVIVNVMFYQVRCLCRGDHSSRAGGGGGARVCVLWVGGRGWVGGGGGGGGGGGVGCVHNGLSVNTDIKVPVVMKLLRITNKHL